MRVLYYALGGGHGHVLRGLAVVSRLHGAAAATLIGPARLAPWAAALGVEYVAAPESGPPAWMAALPPPDFLLVDVFPRGVVAELVPWLGRVPAWLVSRWVGPAYYLHPRVRTAIERAYERLVWTEAPPAALRALDVPQVEVAPVLLRPEPLGREAARRALAVAPGRRLLLGLGSGDVERQALLCRLLGKLAARLDVEMRFISAELPAALPVVSLFPAARVLAAADVIVAAGGYHAVHETRLAAVPAVFIPQRRRHDDQWHRVRGAPVATDPLDLERLVRGSLAAMRPSPLSPTAAGALSSIPLAEGGGPGGGARPASAVEAGDGAAALARLVERRVQAGGLRQEEIAAMA